MLYLIIADYRHLSIHFLDPLPEKQRAASIFIVLLESFFLSETVITELFASFFSYVMREQPDGVWGRRVNGSFIGMMGRLEKQEVDYCTLCGITPNRHKIIDHLPCHPSDPITVVSLKPSLLPQHFLLVRPFTG